MKRNGNEIWSARTTSSISRRRFLKVAATATGAAAISPYLGGAQAFGADAVLLVPCRIGGMKMPLPWEFLIDFDERQYKVVAYKPQPDGTVKILLTPTGNPPSFQPPTSH